MVKTRILDTAEHLFANHGYHGVTLRELTRKASVNLAAVNYHFGDMEAVYREVLLRRLRPLNARRMQLLETTANPSEGLTPSLETVIDSLARPLFDLYRSPGSGGRDFVQLVARAVTEPLPHVQQLLVEEYHPMLNRFAQVIRRHSPQLTPEEFMWRLSFIVGALHHTIATLHQMPALTRGICRTDDSDQVLARFVIHAVATFRAPSSGIKPVSGN